MRFQLASLLFLSIGSGFVVSARAELRWNEKIVETTATAGTEVVTAHYRFTNGGSAPVDIRQVESSCGCTTAELAQRHYEPGQSGEIVARFAVAGHMGLQHKTLAVWSSDLQAPTTLDLLVHVPEVAHLDPAYVTWTHDELAKPKTITLQMLQDIAPNDLTVQSSTTGMDVRLETEVKGKRYQLVVTPAQTHQFAHAILTVHCRFGEREQTFRTYATVQPSLAPP